MSIVRQGSLAFGKVETVLGRGRFLWCVFRRWGRREVIVIELVFIEDGGLHSLLIRGHGLDESLAAGVADCIS